MAGSAALVLSESSGGVATVTLNRPEKLNALSRELIAELETALDAAARDDAVRCIVLAGAGRAFCAGADLGGGGQQRGLRDRWDNYERVNARQFSLWQIDKPIIAAVHGYCLGRGLETALWCDVVIASEDARLGQPEIREASVVSSIIPWLIGMQKAKMLMLSGDAITAAEAERIGLIAQCVPEGQALPAARKLAQRISHLPAPAARAVKRMVNSVYESQGIRSVQAGGALLSSMFAAMTAEETETAWLEDIRRDQGLKGYIQARDAPFKDE